jgi:hypothetical protein
MSRKKVRPEKKKVARRARHLEEAGVLTHHQSKFAVAFAETRRKDLAAIEAGYKGNPAQAGYQAFKAIQRKAPDVIAKMGISLENVIENHILPKMSATETLYFQHEGRVTDERYVEAHMVNLHATRTLLELMNAFPPEDPMVAAQVGVKVIKLDIPWHPNDPPIDVAPTDGNKQKELASAKATGANPTPVKDPRPTD